MKPFQREGIDRLIDLRGGILADEPGNGKSLSALGFVEKTRAYPCVIICPAFLKLNWVKEIDKWNINTDYLVVSSKKDVEGIGDYDVVIINYDLLHQSGSKKTIQLSDVAKAILDINPKSVVIDEIHYLKSSKALRSKATKKITFSCPLVLGLSGTPFLNRPVELYSVLDVINKRKGFGSWLNFTARWCGRKMTPFGVDVSGASNLGELRDKLYDTCMVRRTKKDVMKDLPSKSYHRIYVELSNRKEYDRAENNFPKWFVDKKLKDPKFVEGLGKFSEDQIRAYQNKSYQIGKDYESDLKANALRKLSGVGKVEPAKKWIEGFITSGEPLVVFGHHHDVIYNLAFYFNAPAITGKVSTKQRNQIVNEFQDHQHQLIFCNIEAAGSGFDMTAATNTLFCELPWSPGLYNQAADRIYRLTTESPVTIWNLVGEDSIDEGILKLLQKKQKVFDEVMSQES